MQNLIGQTIANRYRVDVFLGRGGMAEVYKVWDTKRSTYLALKLLHEDLALDKVFLRRFTREANSLARLQHPNIIRFYGLEQQGRQALILLDYIPGETLKHLIFDSPGPLPMEVILQVIRALCSALQFAHSEGLIHCDLKPGNVMFSESGRPMLADFGIARMTDSATATLVGAGTPAYMAPEQVKGLDPVPQTDIYALGVVLFEMLTGGERPFTGELATTTGTTSAKVRWEQVNLSPPSPRKFNTEISPGLEEVMLKCLAKKPRDRFQTPLELLNTLELAVGREIASEPVLEKTQDRKTTIRKERELHEPVRYREPKNLHPANVQTIKRWQRWGGLIGLGGLLIIALAILLSGGGGSAAIPALTYTPALTNTNDLVLSPTFTKTPTKTQPLSLTLPLPSATATPIYAVIGSIENEKHSGAYVRSEPNMESQVLASLVSGTIIEILNITPTIDKHGNKVLNIRFTNKDGVERKGWIFESLVLFSADRPGGGFTQTSPVDGMVQKYIPAGEFMMGCEDGEKNEEPIHPVYVDGFWMDEHEVTNAQYASFLNDEGNQEEGGRNWLDSTDMDVLIEKKSGVWQPVSGYENHPVVEVNWYGARAYCEWTHRRLPTEAEWEKAARGGMEGNLYPWGNENPTCTAGARNGAQYGPCKRGLIPVKTFASNGYGLYDMAGNVWEWVYDWHNLDYYRDSPYEDPTGPSTGEYRVLRGGSWHYDGNDIRVAYRLSNPPSNTSYPAGIRCAQSVSVDLSIETPVPIETPSPTPTVAPALEIGATQISLVDGMVQVYITAGEFLMGTNDTFFARPVHSVYLDPFWMDQHEVTNSQYAQFLNVQGNKLEEGETWLNADHEDVSIVQKNGKWQPKNGYEDHPVVEVSWYGAQAYCEWAGRRLPTEAEWEKAARGGMEGKEYPWGNTFDGDKVNFCDSKCDLTWANNTYNDGYKKTAPVSSYTPNDFGLFDMAGNVSEWVADWFDEDYYVSSSYDNPLGPPRPSTGGIHCLRGGSWYDTDQNIRVSTRGKASGLMFSKFGNPGFRCAESSP